MVAVLGFPVFIACAYLARDMGLLESPLASIPALTREVALLRADLRSHASESREMTRVLRQICRNNAKSETSLILCDPPSYYGGADGH